MHKTWDRVKQSEKSGRDSEPAKYLDAVPRHIPAIIEAWGLGQRAEEVGFDWQNVHEVFAKLEEETNELANEVARSEVSPDAIEDELGDLFFTIVSVARHLKVEPEFALRKANAKFRERFNHMEAAAGGIEPIRNATLEELDSIWRAAKAANASEAESTKADEPRPGSSSE